MPFRIPSCQVINYYLSNKLPLKTTQQNYSLWAQQQNLKPEYSSASLYKQHSSTKAFWSFCLFALFLKIIGLRIFMQLTTLNRGWDGYFGECFQLFTVSTVASWSCNTCTFAAVGRKDTPFSYLTFIYIYFFFCIFFFYQNIETPVFWVKC